jgi:N-methylhydantoinase B
MNSQSQTIPQQHVVDPITLEVIRRGIVSITDQIDANISRTAFSPYIYEYKDFAVGLVGADGELIAQRAQPARGFRGRG